MLSSSPLSARAAAKRGKKFQNGTLLSWTVLTHPPSQFGPYPRTIGLIALEDGSQVLAPLHAKNPRIGMALRPRMSLSHVNDEKLRIYDVAYEELIGVPAPILEKEFPGYIVALTGPSGVGKSTVGNMLVRMVGEYARMVPVTTTRPRGVDEHGEYRHVSRKRFEECSQAGQMVAMAQIDGGGGKEWYGYRKADIDAIWKAGKLPVVATEMHLLQDLAKHFGRRSILSFGLLPPGASKRAMLSHLLRRLRQRGKTTEEWLESKLRSAAKDLQFLRAHADLFDRIIVNDDPQAAAELLRRHVPGMES
jgi:guanylate kinase